MSFLCKQCQKRIADDSVFGHYWKVHEQYLKRRIAEGRGERKLDLDISLYM